MRNVRRFTLGKEALAKYGLTKDPFAVHPATSKDYFYSKDMALAELVIWDAIDQPAISALVGPVGAGKSSAWRRTVAEYLRQDRKYQACTFDVPSMRRVDIGHILNKLLKDLTGDSWTCKPMVDIAEQARAVLGKCDDDNVRPVLGIEDAHLLPVATLQELKLLYELRPPGHERPILSVILIGQPPLARKLDREDLRQLSERTRTYRMVGLDTDLVQYIETRCKRVGAKHTDLFEQAAFKVLFRDPSVKTPQLVNVMCSLALHQAWKLSEDRVTDEVMRRVLSAHRDDADATDLDTELVPAATPAATPAAAATTGGRKAKAA